VSTLTSTAAACEATRNNPHGKAIGFSDAGGTQQLGGVA